MKTITTPVKQISLRPRHKGRLIAYVLLVLANISLFSYTAPLESPAAIVISGFLLVSLDLGLIVHFAVQFSCLLVPALGRARRRLTFALISFSVVATALASLGQLTWRDVAVVVIIWVIGYMYSLRFRLDTK